MKAKFSNYTLNKSGMISSEVAEIVKKISEERNISITRLLGYAFDNELSKPIPFDFPTHLPSDEYQENAYASEASKIMDFMKLGNIPLPLDTLLLLRRKIGIPNRTTMLYALRECVMVNQLVRFKKDRSSKYAPVAEEYYHYRLADLKPKPARKSKEEKEILELERLKKKYESDPEMQE